MTSILANPLAVDHNRTIINMSNRFHGLTNSVPAIGAMMESLDLVISAGRGVLCPKSVTSSVNG
ncbi:hypothetical protein BgiBS90_013949 [Biomphalaria glabrata]|nr:hypothetical protein BgiMline_027427 [Biomphalaria glabrata]KAI8784422.1 hypothetical protein BgiBS90_013949 [Biomphalaria glabrata]